MRRTELVFRLGLIGAGCLLLYTSFDVFTTGSTISFPPTVLLLVLCGGAGLLLLGAAARPIPNLPRWVILIAFLINGTVVAFVWAQTLGVTRTGRPMIGLTQTDSAVYTDMAAGLLLRGHNPYDWDYSAAMSAYRLSDMTGTPTLLGNQESPYPYPPLTVLLAAPFLAVGLPPSFCLLLFTYFILLILVFHLSPRFIAPLALLPFGIGFTNDLSIFSLIGLTDLVWVVLLVALAAFWERPTWAAVLFGLAAASKQTPWLIAPYLLIRLYREQPDGAPGIQAILRFGFISGGIFLGINLPFIAAAPSLWLRGVLEPLTDTLVMFGQNSPVNLTQYGYLYLPKSYFLYASLIVLITLCLVYWRHFQSLRDAVWLFPGIYMWFSYRTLTTYWTFWVFPALLVVYRAPSHRPPARREASVRVSLGLVGVTCLTLIGLGVVMALPPQMQITVHAPIFVGLNGRVNEMTIEVRNVSQQFITPRFAVQQTAYAANPLLWQVLSGLPQLAPDSTSTYRIAPRGDSNSFYANDIAQVLVTDAEDYTLRAVALVGERSLLWPDAIPNSRFTMWNYAGTSPILWEPAFMPPDRVEMTTRTDGDVLRLVLTGDPDRTTDRSVSLGAQIIFPQDTFRITYLTEPDFPTAATVGIEIDDGVHSKRLPFTPTNGRWDTAEINLPHVYQTAGWDRPPLQRAVFRGMDLPFRLIRIRFSVWLTEPTDQPAEAYFKGIESPSYPIPPETLMQETLADPVAYYLRLGDDLAADGNALRAAAAYQLGLSYQPDNVDLRNHLQHVLQTAGENR